jgi:hypothetical protein
MKTNLDLYFDSQKAALASLDLKLDGSLDTHNAASEAFLASGNDPIDWEYWFSIFTHQVGYQRLLRGQKAKSEVIKVQASAHLPKLPPTPSAAPAVVPAFIAYAVPVVTESDLVVAAESAPVAVAESTAVEIAQQELLEAAPVAAESTK